LIQINGNFALNVKRSRRPTPWAADRGPTEGRYNPGIDIANRASRHITQDSRLWQTNSGNPISPWIGSLPLVGRRLGAAWDRVVEVKGNLRALRQPYTADLEQVMIAAARALADSLLQVLVSLVVATMFWVNGDALVALLHDALRRTRRCNRRAGARRRRRGDPRRRLWGCRHRNHPGRIAGNRPTPSPASQAARFSASSPCCWPSARLADRCSC
jgi:hypothetical protein